MEFPPKGVLNFKISIFCYLIESCTIFIDNNLRNILLNEILICWNILQLCGNFLLLFVNKYADSVVCLVLSQDFTGICSRLKVSSPWYSKVLRDWGNKPVLLLSNSWHGIENQKVYNKIQNMMYHCSQLAKAIRVQHFIVVHNHWCAYLLRQSWNTTGTDAILGKS